MIYIRNEATKHCFELEALKSESEVLLHLLHGLARRLRWFADEPKDAEQQDKIARSCNAYLTERCVSRILHDGNVVCDASNNTAAHLANDQVVVTAFLKLKPGDEFYAISLSNKSLEP